ncbi:MAG: enoyl-CoA hydratase/isomerase family protein [Deltaproteobacteria bacterium]|nr:enoyl-CoA hydratase/isomerase family protein [Deltaproteobacteria bacterium]MBW2397703.1 enoyl-CoA hydratase/isomerase family protein [Deltaproteobacteria bacterium]MBW2665351.1 enoyl-CoA hydratase/isomerase family protein [Deltaproteobacteria bacterium]
MTSSQRFGDVGVDVGGDFVATVEIHRPPHNYFDAELIRDLAAAFEALDEDAHCRAIVLCSEGKNFCAGAQIGGGARPKPSAEDAEPARHLYDEAVRLFATRTPVVAAIQGAAIGGGLGLALMPDFRIAAPEARFAANFARLGFHHGFGLSVTLPDLVGGQKAMELLYTGRRLHADEAHAIGLVDRIAPLGELRAAASEFAREIAGSAPQAVRSIRETLRGDLAERIRTATDREKIEQERLQQTKDFREGVRAMGERRTPDFTGN